MVPTLVGQVTLSFDPATGQLSNAGGALNQIRNGTTTIIDHHASPACRDGSLDTIADAEHRYVESANYLERVARGILLVDAQRFKFEEATTHLIALAPLFASTRDGRESPASR